MGQRARRFYEPPAAALIGDSGALRPCDGRTLTLTLTLTLTQTLTLTLTLTLTR